MYYLAQGDVREMSEVKKHKTVKKPHNIITAKMHFEAREQNILMMLMSSVSQKLTDDYFRSDKNSITKSADNPLIFKYSLADIAVEWGVSLRAISKNINGLNIVEASARKLWDFDVFIKNNNGSFEAYRILQHMKFEDESLILHLTQKFYEEMIDFKKKGFGKVELNTYYSLKSPVSQRLFEIATRFAAMNKLYETTIGEFCETIGANFEQYTRPSTFTNTCLKRPIEQILKQTDKSWIAGSKYGYTIKKRPEDKGKLTKKSKLRLDLRPASKKQSIESDAKLKNLVDDYKAILELKFRSEDKERLTQILEEIDNLEQDKLDELEIKKDANFIKNWSILMMSNI